MLLLCRFKYMVSRTLYGYSNFDLRCLLLFHCGDILRIIDANIVEADLNRC